MSKQLVSAAFRCDKDLYEEIRTIAEGEGRSIAATFAILFKAALVIYREKGSLKEML